MIPYRVCCGQQHTGAMCPDGLVMCCHCFERVGVDQLAVLLCELVDVCKPCAIKERDYPKEDA